MSARDKIHDAVKNSLIKDGWKITADPYVIKYDDVKLEADLAAERPLGAERDDRKIVVEIKSFLGPSPLYELEGALGQYQIYSALLRVTNTERELYLAISHIAYTNIFERKVVQLIMQQYRLALLVVDVQQEEIVRWIEPAIGEP